MHLFMIAIVWVPCDRTWRGWSGSGLAAASEHFFAPIKVVEKPPRSRLQALFKPVAWLPAQLVADPRGVNRTAAGVAGSVAHKGDQVRGWSALWTQLIHQGVDRLHHLAVIAFPAASYALAGA